MALLAEAVPAGCRGCSAMQ